MVENRIDSVKKEIRSVLISSKDGSSLVDFIKSYKTLLGSRLPSREFGFTTDMDFLYSLPDVVHIQVDGSGSYHLYAIADQATEHIQKLVSKQRRLKVNPKRKNNYSQVNKHYQTLAPTVSPRCRPFVPALLRAEIIGIVKQYPDGIGYVSLVQAYQRFYKKSINFGWLSSNNDERFKTLSDAIPEIDLRVTGNQLKMYYKNFHQNNVNTKDISTSCMRLQHLKAKSSLKAESSEIESEKTFVDRSSIPENVQSDFVKVLKQYPKGIFAVDFPILYEKLTKKPLELHDLGYNSLIELVEALPNIFSCKNLSETSKNWILLHKDFSQKASAKEWKPCPGLKSVIHSTNLTRAKLSPSYSFRGAIPPDIAQPSLRFVQKELPDEATEKFIPVFVSSVINPEIFWVQLQTKEAVLNFEKLEKEMKCFYDNQGDSYRMADKDIMIGSSCVAFSTTDYHWYRALITSMPSIEDVIVSFVDYGGLEKIHRSNLYYLKYTFINLPAHAHKAKLASIKPGNQLSKWNMAAQKRFIQLCNHLFVMAKIDSMNDDVLSLLLCDTSGDDAVHINDTLVKEGLAEFYLSDDFSPNSSLNANNPCLENGVELSSNDRFQAHILSDIKRNIIEPETSSGYCSENTVELFSNDRSQAQMLSDIKRNTIEPETPNGHCSSRKREIPKLHPKRLFIEKLEALQLFSKKRRYVKKVLLGDGYKINVIVVDNEAYVSGGDLCNLFWTDKEADVLALKLKFKGAIIPTISISEVDFEEIFFQCKRYSVKGFQDTGEETSVVLYPLKYVMKVLNIFGHPSLSVRETLHKEVTNFDPCDPFWNTFQEPDKDETVVHTKIAPDGHCVYDLKAWFEDLRFKRLQLQKRSENSSNLSEINKIERTQRNIMRQIDAINSLCSRYPS